MPSLHSHPAAGLAFRLFLLCTILSGSASGFHAYCGTSSATAVAAAAESTLACSVIRPTRLPLLFEGEPAATFSNGSGRDGVTAGVDFSSVPLETEPVTITQGGGGEELRFALRVKKLLRQGSSSAAVPPPAAASMYGLLGAAVPVSPFFPQDDVPTWVQDSFFVWLGLQSGRFWVNLKPHEPHRIMDALFATTHAGKILLEADLLLKKTVGVIMNPRYETGRRFWDTFYQHIDQVTTDMTELCFTFRQWAVPDDHQLRVLESVDTLFLLQAPLTVMMESEFVRSHDDDDGGGGWANPVGCPPGADPRVQQYAELLFRQLVLPLLIDYVNTGEEFAPLRWVFATRVLAEWYKAQQHRRGQATVYDEFRDGDSIEPWQLEAGSWDPMDVWRAYVQSASKGEFDLIEYLQDADDRDELVTRTYFYGAINFQTINLRLL